MDKVKMAVIAVVTALMSWLGWLAVPVFVLVACNVLDYITGLIATKYRKEKISSYKSVRGITKKICMWLLVFVGALIDILINYAIETAGLNITLPFVVAMLVAVWLAVNEIISVLENIIDIGVTIPPFMLPIVRYIKTQVEEKTEINVEGKAEKGE